MKKSILFFFVITLFLTGNVYAQVIKSTTYAFNRATAGPSAWTWVPLIPAGSDNVASVVTDIGFTFWFAGTSYTQFSVNENGLMTLGSIQISGTDVANDMASGVTIPKIAPYWDDLTTGTVNGGGGVGYYLQGTAPNRTLYVNWNVTVPKNIGNAANTILQVKLLEATNQIILNHGAIPINAGAYTIGIGKSGTDYASVVATQTAASCVYYPTASDNDNTNAINQCSYNFTPDYTAPPITYTLIPSVPGTANRILTAVIADYQTGVPTSGILVPRIYYKKGVDGVWVSAPGSFSSGTITNATFTFTVDHQSLGGVTGGDQIYYYVIAQDQSASGEPNIASNPAGVVATDVNTVLTPPTTPNIYTVGADFSGVKTVGTGGDYTSLTLLGGLFDQINAGQLTGNLTINIISDLTAETGLKALNAWINGPGGPFTITINPVGDRIVSGITVNGGNGSVIPIVGASGVTIDGLNNGTNSLTFIQTGQYYVGSMIDLKGASNNTIKNVTINGYGASNYAISITNSTTPSLPSSNNTISNCIISTSVLIPNTSNCGNGIGLLGTATLAGDNNKIENNTITNVVYYHIIVNGKYTNTQISGNNVYNTVGTSWHNTYSAVNISTPTGSGITNVFNNKIHDILTQSYFSTGGIPAIYANGVSGTTTNIYNNVINLDIAFNPLVTRYGIRTNNSGAVNIYYNSIYIGGTDITEGNSYGLYRGGTGATNIKNNVVFNARSNSTGTGKHYGIYVTGTTSLTSDYNDIYTPGTGGVFGFSTTDLLTLTDWQTATGKDANSLNVDPQFTSLTDLLPLNADLNAGTPIAGITTDFAGVTRNETTPTIGAYEMAHTATALNLNLFLEGLYAGAGTMNQAFDASGPHWPAGVADHITVELREAANYAAVVYTFTDVPLSTSGIVSLTVPQAYTGNYFITIKHRNSVETTTPSAKSFTASIVSHDFTTANTMAYGNNLKNLSGVYMIFGGDVNQDGSVDTGDMLPVDNDSFNYAFGYLNADVNGDGSVDTGDMIIVDNNSANYIGTMHP